MYEVLKSGKHIFSDVFFFFFNLEFFWVRFGSANVFLFVLTILLQIHVCFLSKPSNKVFRGNVLQVQVTYHGLHIGCT